MVEEDAVAPTKKSSTLATKLLSQSLSPPPASLFPSYFPSLAPPPPLPPSSLMNPTSLEEEELEGMQSYDDGVSDANRIASATSSALCA